MNLLALKTTPANEQDRAQVAELCAKIKEATGGNVEVAFADQGYTGEKPAAEAAAAGIRLEVIKLAEAKRGFVLLPKRWVFERRFGWAARFRRLARDYERLSSSLENLHWLAFTSLMLAALFRSESLYRLQSGASVRGQIMTRSRKYVPPRSTS